MENASATDYGLRKPVDGFDGRNELRRSALKTVGIIVAGGKGTRIEGNLPKQFIMLGDKPIAAHAIEKFENCGLIDEIILVVPEDYLGYSTQKVIDKYGFRKADKIVPGGEKRQDSVYAGLKACPAGTSIVAIHDAVRPLISSDKIAASVELCVEKKAVVLAVPPKDTIKRGEDGLIVTTLDRDKLWLIQTPQVFDYELILEAHEKAREDTFVGTDDSVLVERLGKEVTILKGDYSNIKITTEEDLALAGTLIRRQKDAASDGQ
jgi:2-C-methyl-D-erythritol 4-phosphate cytidylyltransferase